MRRAAAFAVLLGISLCGGAAAPAERTLPLPRPLRAGDTAWIEVHVGAIGPGREIHVTAADGRELGVITPFAIRPGRAAGIYTLPLPVDVIEQDHVRIRLDITHGGAKPQAPNAQEVTEVRVIVEGPSTAT